MKQMLPLKSPTEVIDYKQTNLGMRSTINEGKSERGIQISILGQPLSTTRAESANAIKRKENKNSGSKSLKQFIMEQKRELRKARALKPDTDVVVVNEVSLERQQAYEEIHLTN